MVVDELDRPANMLVRDCSLLEFLGVPGDSGADTRVRAVVVDELDQTADMLACVPGDAGVDTQVLPAAAGVDQVAGVGAVVHCMGCCTGPRG